MARYRSIRAVFVGVVAESEGHGAASRIRLETMSRRGGLLGQLCEGVWTLLGSSGCEARIIFRRSGTRPLSDSALLRGLFGPRLSSEVLLRSSFTIVFHNSSRAQ